MEESQDQKDERYVVKATPMTAGSSGLETPPTSSETMVKCIIMSFEYYNLYCEGCLKRRPWISEPYRFISNEYPKCY